ncbi:hypothetical protein BASA61_004369 [Batrachochytrium salamandrivorans]|nr:hypothetical protein BASA61_004369 [Batrachochytrium salamandrivorans]
MIDQTFCDFQVRGNRQLNPLNLFNDWEAYDKSLAEGVAGIVLNDNHSSEVTPTANPHDDGDSCNANDSDNADGANITNSSPVGGAAKKKKKKKKSNKAKASVVDATDDLAASAQPVKKKHRNTKKQSRQSHHPSPYLPGFKSMFTPRGDSRVTKTECISKTYSYHADKLRTPHNNHNVGICGESTQLLKLVRKSAYTPIYHTMCAMQRVPRQVRSYAPNDKPARMSMIEDCE